MSALTCSTYSKVFYDKHSRQRHESLVHRLDGRYGCDQCGRKFANPGDLEYHLGAKHRKTKEKRVDCEECGKTFKNNDTLRLHRMYMHSEVNKHECDKCNSKFARKDNLTRHKAENHTKLKLNWTTGRLKKNTPLWSCKCFMRYVLYDYKIFNFVFYYTSTQKSHIMMYSIVSHSS